MWRDSAIWIFDSFNSCITYDACLVKSTSVKLEPFPHWLILLPNVSANTKHIMKVSANIICIVKNNIERRISQNRSLIKGSRLINVLKYWRKVAPIYLGSWKKIGLTWEKWHLISLKSTSQRRRSNKRRHCNDGWRDVDISDNEPRRKKLTKNGISFNVKFYWRRFQATKKV